MNEPMDSFDARLSVAVTREMRDAIARAASAQRKSISDFARSAISEELTLIGVPYDRAAPTMRARR